MKLGGVERQSLQRSAVAPHTALKRFWGFGIDFWNYASRQPAVGSLRCLAQSKVSGVVELECGPEPFCDRGAARSLALGGLWLGGIHGHMDREPPVERRDCHVRHGVRLADHQPRRQSDDRVLGPGRRQPAAVPVYPAVRRLGERMKCC
jgi:hypothetical protein